MLSNRLSSSEDASLAVPPAGEPEEKLLHLCCAVVQNIALHPDNRTRLYKVGIRIAKAGDTQKKRRTVGLWMTRSNSSRVIDWFGSFRRQRGSSRPENARAILVSRA